MLQEHNDTASDTDIDPLLDRAASLFANEAYEESLPLFEELIELGVSDEQVLVARAICLLHLQQLEDAEKAFLIACYHYPDNQVALSGLKSLGAAYTLPVAWLRDSKHRPSDIEELPIIETPNHAPHRAWYRARNLSAVGRYGLLLTDAGTVVHASDCEGDRYINAARRHVPLDFSRNDHRRTVPGRYMSLLGLWSDAFFHWLLEYLPMVIRAEELKLDCTYIVSPKPDFISQSLLHVGVPPTRIFFWDAIPSRFEELIIPSHIPSWVFQNYPERQRMLRNAILAPLGSTPAPRQQIYIKRTDPSRPRRVTNSEQLETMLAKYDFRSVEMEKISLVEQFRLVANSDALVTPHGAAMVHSLLMPEGSLVVEMFAPNYINPCMLQTMQLLNHRYHMVASYLNSGSKYAHGDDIEAAILPVELAVSNWRNTRGSGNL